MPCASPVGSAFEVATLQRVRLSDLKVETRQLVAERYDMRCWLRVLYSKDIGFWKGNSLAIEAGAFDLASSKNKFATTASHWLSPSQGV